MQIIDFRCRPPFENLARDWIFRLEDQPGNPGLASKYSKMNMPLPASLLSKSMQVFLNECGKAEISKSVVPNRILSTQSNEDLVRLLSAYPDNFIGFAGIQPAEAGVSASIAQMEKYATHGPCAGIYMEPGLDPHPWEVDNHVFFPIYDYCEKNDVPICFLYGGVFHRKNPPSYDLYDPMRIEFLASKYPGVRFLLSHACWPFAELACAIALNLENVWLSPDGFMVDHPGSQDYVVAANYRLQDKIIFGSLYPSMPVDFAVEKYKHLLRPEVWPKVFYENAARYLKLDAGHGIKTRDNIMEKCG